MGVIVHVNIIFDHLGAGYQREVTQIWSLWLEDGNIFLFTSLKLKRINSIRRLQEDLLDHSSCVSSPLHEVTVSALFIKQKGGKNGCYFYIYKVRSMYQRCCKA